MGAVQGINSDWAQKQEKVWEREEPSLSCWTPPECPFWMKTVVGQGAQEKQAVDASGGQQKGVLGSTLDTGEEREAEAKRNDAAGKIS